jgi:hypothetical protein
MKENMRIDWMQGMEVIPATMIAADNYHIFHHELNRRLLTQQSYGLLPRVKFDISGTITNNLLQIQEIHCDAITRNGQFIQFHGPFTTPLPQDSSLECFLVIKTKGVTHQAINEIPYSEIICDFEFRQRVELSDGNILPVIKLLKEHEGWRMAEYIPPCFTLSSCRLFIARYEEIRKIMNEISGLIRDKGFPEHILHFYSLLFLEVNSLSKNEIPFDLILLLKKTVHTVVACEPQLQESSEGFLKSEYDPNDVLTSLDKARMILKRFREILETIKEPLPEQPAEPEEWVPSI